jgi:hypothetical protein
VSIGVRVCELGGADCVGVSVRGKFEPPAAVGLAARAWPDIAMARPAATKSAERIRISWVVLPNPSPNEGPANIVPK